MSTEKVTDLELSSKILQLRDSHDNYVVRTLHISTPRAMNALIKFIKEYAEKAVEEARDGT